MPKGILLPGEITSDLAYLLGVFAGDGSLGHRPDKYEHSLKCVGHPRDERTFYTEVIGPAFKRVFGIFPEMRLYDKGTTFGFRVFSKALVRYLHGLGLPIGPKWHSLHIPACVREERLLSVVFLRGLFDTDGCITFKRRYRMNPYYPVISLATRRGRFAREVVDMLELLGLNAVYSRFRVNDERFTRGFTITNRIELNGVRNLQRWMRIIGFASPKHLRRIKENGRELVGDSLADSGG